MKSVTSELKTKKKHFFSPALLTAILKSTTFAPQFNTKLFKSLSKLSLLAF
jgi:hypothetical protein